MRCAVRPDGQSRAQVMQALLANSVDVVAGAFEQNLQLAAQGRPVKAFALLVQQSSRVLVAQTSTNKGLRTLEDLKGAVVGVAGLGSVNHLFLNYLLLRHGLKPTDVRTVAIGVGSSAVAALEHKRVDAAVLVGNETRWR